MLWFFAVELISMKYLDEFLNRITMYRLVLDLLIIIWLWATLLGSLGKIAYDPISLTVSTLVILFFCYTANLVLSRLFRAPINTESTYISVLILSLIVTPAQKFSDLPFLFWLCILTIASKYILTINKKHLFNPVAAAVAITALSLNRPAVWWVGNPYLFPAVLVSGYLVVRKIKREDLVISFLAVSILAILVFTLTNGQNPWSSFRAALLDSPLLFFAFVMLTEPQTTPPGRKLRILYGGLVGLLFAPQIHFGNFYLTPELALIIGNIFSYVVSPKQNLLLTFKEKIELTPNLYDFVFTPEKPFSYEPGQYLEWTLNQSEADNRGNRRYFTLASSPTEEDIRIGVKFYEPSSSFKKTLRSLEKGEIIAASQLDGQFTLPKDKNKKLVFLTGGIGVTPFRSMIKYLLDRQELRTITLIYSNKTEEEIAYRGIFDEAQKKIGLQVIYTLTDLEKIRPNWTGERGVINQEMISKNIPDFQERIYYISGPRSLVLALKKSLEELKIAKNQILTDYFPGYA